MRSFLILPLVAALAVAAPTQEENMNGEYIISSTPGALNASAFPTNYKDFPGGVEYFDVYSPNISTLYSQVFWTTLPAVDLPPEIVARFKGKAMAVVGFELDQVRRTPEGDVSLPFNLAYNHHFESSMTGAHSYLKKVKTADLPNGHAYAHGHPDPDYAWIPEDKGTGFKGVPTSQGFGAANGGEVRKSFHGFASGIVQAIQSPEQFHITPMQIDTWNRDKMNLTGSPFVPGPVPKTSLAPQSGPDAIYSGLLECPLTTRIRKLVEGEYSTRVAGVCGADRIATAQECYSAAEKVGFPAGSTFITQQGDSSTLPAGCSATVQQTSGNATVKVFFNTASTSTEDCSNGSSGPRTVTGTTSSLVNVTVTLDSTNATITLTGPSDVWYGVGFNATEMKDAPWTVIVDGNGAVTERVLAEHAAGNQIPASVSVLSNSVTGGVRTVVVTRPLKGVSAEYFTFDQTQQTQIPFINAIGSTVAFSYHKDKTGASMTLLPKDDGINCVCAKSPAPFGEGKGSLQYEGSTTVGFGNKCAPQPRSDLLAQNNPTCDVRTYVGGQTACHHMWSLLDADQDIPWNDQPLEYQLKFRFWFQEFDPNFHKQAIRTTWGIASPVEYDVPQCAPGTPTAECIHTITGTFPVPKPRGGEAFKLVAAHFHCHAPTCLSIAMYNNATGNLICEEKPIYGGTGVIDQKRFDEPGYIAQPPCLWGPTSQGLEEPVDVGGQTLHIVKHSNSTYGHHGEMAWLQMFYILE